MPENTLHCFIDTKNIALAEIKKEKSISEGERDGRTLRILGKMTDPVYLCRKPTYTGITETTAYGNKTANPTEK